ncbi:MAG: hypothetical protein ACYCYR_09600 [Desulfobulbaceae bacterium]|jgi:hypothetical protein
MLATIQAIKAALQASATLAYVKDKDVYITEDIRMIRASGEYPAFGIKDGGTVYDFQSGDQEEDSLELTIACYVQLLRPEQAIIGTPDGKPGVLKMAEDLVALLKDNTLGGTVTQLLPLRAGASEILPEQNRAIQMLPVPFRITKWR